VPTISPKKVWHFSKKSYDFYWRQTDTHLGKDKNKLQHKLGRDSLSFFRHCSKRTLAVSTMAWAAEMPWKSFQAIT
jgi:hypothetical protein